MNMTARRDEVRSPAEVAQRSLALFSVIGLAMGAPRSEVLQWLNDNDLWKWLAPSEIGFMDKPVPSKQQTIDMVWQSERLIVLLWSLRKIEHLPAPDEQCDTEAFQTVLPPFADVSVQDFVMGARLRPEGELIEMADRILDLHWEARDAKHNGRMPRRPVDIEIIQERHHAINWVIGYGGLPWDAVTSDT